MSGIKPGANAVVRITVTERDTASAIGSGDVPVLATPRLLALAEEATVKSLQGLLEPGATSVGTSVSLKHERASPIGADIFVSAQLVAVEGRCLRFTFSAWQTTGEAGVDVEPGKGEHIGSGTIERVLVQREGFIASAQERRPPQ